MSGTLKNGAYRVGQKLGQGAFGTVFICRQVDAAGETSKEECVVKQIYVENLETIQVNVECNILKQLNHRHVLRYYDSFYEDNNICIVTEYCRLGDLDEYLKRQQKEGRPNAKRDKLRIGPWILQIIKALHYLHSKKILHRDLKTKNVFLRSTTAQKARTAKKDPVTKEPLPEMVLGDFGVAKILQDATANQMASTFIGTPYYMSPEQLNQTTYSKVCDIWAAGCVFFEMIELKRAINAQTLMHCMIVVTTAPTPKLTNPEFTDWQEIVNGMLQKNPAFRSTTGDLLKRFSFYDDGTVSAAPYSPQISSGSPHKTPKMERSSRRRTSEKDLTPKQLMMLRKQQRADERARLLSAASQNRQEEIKKHRDSGKSSTMGRQIDILSTSSRRKMEEDEWADENISHHYHDDPYHGDPLHYHETKSTSSEDTFFGDDDPPPQAVDDEPVPAYGTLDFSPIASPPQEHPKEFLDTFFVDDSIRPGGETVDEFAGYLASFGDDSSLGQSKTVVADPVYEDDFEIPDTSTVKRLSQMSLGDSGRPTTSELEQYPKGQSRGKTPVEKSPHSGSSVGSGFSRPNSGPTSRPASGKSSTMRPISASSSNYSYNSTGETLKPINENHMLVRDQIMLAKITRLKQKCIDQLGEILFYQVYEILLEQREAVDKNPADPYKSKEFISLQVKLEGIVTRSSDCMCVDQLIYLESECGII